MANDNDDTIGWNFLQKPFIHYDDRDLQLAFARYASDKTIVVKLYDNAEKEDTPWWTTVTTAVPNSGIDRNSQILVCTWNNEGLMEVLEKAGIIKDTKVRIPSGFVSIPICNLLIKPKGFKDVV